MRRQGMPQNTEHTVTDIETLLADRFECCKRGYAFVDEEQMAEIRAVGAPVMYSETEVEGAIAISGPTARLKGEKFGRTFPEKVVQAANICEVNLHTIRDDALEVQG